MKSIKVLSHLKRGVSIRKFLIQGKPIVAYPDSIWLTIAGLPYLLLKGG